MRENLWCDRCKEEFPVASTEEEKSRIRMGLLYPKKRMPKKVREHYSANQETSNYLCGNCYFDILDLIE